MAHITDSEIAATNMPQTVVSGRWPDHRFQIAVAAKPAASA